MTTGWPHSSSPYFAEYFAGSNALFLRGLTPQNNPAIHTCMRLWGNWVASGVAALQPKNQKGTPQHWRNPAKMDRGHVCSIRRFGHKAVRSQMPQTCASTAIWPRNTVLRGFLRGCFAGSILANVWPRKRPCKTRHDPKILPLFPGLEF